jgi:hypothetical protein
MEIYDVKFDNNQGNAEIDLVSGVIKITATESNPQFPTGLAINIPIDPLFAKLQAQAPNLLVKWAEQAAQGAIDGVT